MARTRLAPMRSLAVGLFVLVCLPGCAMKTRAVTSAPIHKTMGATVEGQDPALSAALLMLTLSPTAEHHRAVADEYRRLRILDTAFDHLSAATRLDPRDAAAYDARARIWRDSGFPELGMGDSARAVFYAPRSAAAHNTRGTLLAAAGLTAEALREFEIAIALDPEASFARENVCRLVGC